jgi:hypothetical protein
VKSKQTTSSIEPGATVIRPPAGLGMRGFALATALFASDVEQAEALPAATTGDTCKPGVATARPASPAIRERTPGD